MNPRAAGQASFVGGIHVVPALGFEAEVLDTDVVIRVCAAVGLPQSEPSAVVRVDQVDDLLGAALRGVADLLGQAERAKEFAVEPQRRLDIRDGEIDVMDG